MEAQKSEKEGGRAYDGGVEAGSHWVRVLPSCQTANAVNCGARVGWMHIHQLILVPTLQVQLVLHGRVSGGSTTSFGMDEMGRSPPR